MRLTLASYNIHACIGADGRFDPLRTARVIGELDADVIALQEVEHHLVSDLDLLDFLARETGMIPLAGPTMYRESRHYGNALLLRHPPHAYQLLDLSMDAREPRGAIQACLQLDGKRIVLCATHLGLKPAERRWQVRQILQSFEQVEADISVLMGDLNEWFLWGRTLRLLKSYFDTTPSCRSFPARWPLLALDRIWVSPRDRMLSLTARNNVLIRKASDHLPVLAELEL